MLLFLFERIDAEEGEPDCLLGDDDFLLVTLLLLALVGDDGVCCFFKSDDISMAAKIVDRLRSTTTPE